MPISDVGPSSPDSYAACGTLTIFGFAFAPWLGLVAAMALAGFVGTLIGRRLLLRLDERRFGRILAAILVLIALRLVWTGGAALLDRAD